MSRYRVCPQLLLKQFKEKTIRSRALEEKENSLFIELHPTVILRLLMKMEIDRAVMPAAAKWKLYQRVEGLKIETRFISAFEWNVTPWQSEDEHQTLEAAKHVVNNIKEKGMGLLGWDFPLSWDIFVEAYVA